MKNVLVISFTLILSTSLWAQGEDQTDCDQPTISSSDVGCTGPHNCTATTGCSSRNFTVACTGIYSMDAWVTCAECKKCMSCVNIYENGQLIPGGNCHNLNCDTGDCDYTCTVNLVEGHQYTLYVCLVGCDGGSCEGCSEDNCTAWGCLRWNAITPCY